MTITLPPQTRTDAIASLRRYFETNLEPIGELPATLLLDFLEEIAPAVYNQAIHDAQTQLAQRLADLPGDLYHKEFQYWPNHTPKRRRP